MLIREFLSCPVCEPEHEEIWMSVDGEHIAIGCEHCDSRVKEFHRDHERFSEL